MADLSTITLSQYCDVFIPFLLEDEKDARFDSYSPGAMTALKTIQLVEKILKTSKATSSQRAQLIAKFERAQLKLNSARLKLITSSYQLWLKAQEAELPLIVLGSSELREPGPLRENFKDLTHEKPDRGSILVTKEWSMIHNDGMLLGAYIAGKDCAVSLATGYPKSADVHNQYGPRVLLREIAMLKALGYQQVTPEKDIPMLGMLFQLPAHKSPAYMSFKNGKAKSSFCKSALTTMRRAAADTRTIAAAKKLFNGWGSPPVSPKGTAALSPCSSASSVSFSHDI